MLHQLFSGVFWVSRKPFSLKQITLEEVLVQFAVIGLDGTDENAMSRRMAARESHLALAKTMTDEKHLLHACALLDEAEQMMGSIMVVDFNTREDLDNWLKVEPYMVGKVWEKLEVRPCKVSPNFLK